MHTRELAQPAKVWRQSAHRQQQQQQQQQQRRVVEPVALELVDDHRLVQGRGSLDAHSQLSQRTSKRTDDNYPIMLT